jgi:cytidylate kinase
MTSRVIAIDGPSGSGKSTTAQAIAERLGFAHVDSGALYRAVALAALDAGLALDGPAIVDLAESCSVGFRLTDEGYRPEVAGVDVSKEIRSDRVTAHSSPVSALPDVRNWVNTALRAAVASHPKGAVLDGRDIGSVVFPDAALKVYLTANDEERARRRLIQQGRPSDDANIKEAVDRMAGRDTADSTRAVAPLSIAEGAVVIDTTELTFEEQVSRVIELAGAIFD